MRSLPQQGLESCLADDVVDVEVEDLRATGRARHEHDLSGAQTEGFADRREDCGGGGTVDRTGTHPHDQGAICSLTP